MSGLGLVNQSTKVGITNGSLPPLQRNKH